MKIKQKILDNLYHHYLKNKDFIPNITRWAKHLGVARNTLKKHLKDLLQQGYVVKKDNLLLLCGAIV